MLLNDSTRLRHLAKAALLAVVCLVGLLATMEPAGSARVELRASVGASASTYPKAGVILWRKIAAHSKPSESSRTITVFPQFRKDFRPTTLLVLGERRGTKGSRWLKLLMPMRPNGRTGWVKAVAV